MEIPPVEARGLLKALGHSRQRNDSSIDSWFRREYLEFPHLRITPAVVVEQYQFDEFGLNRFDLENLIRKRFAAIDILPVVEGKLAH